jgi:hypothetical protein
VAVVLLAALSSTRTAAAQELVDSVRPYLVFAPVGESWFVASNRGKRMLLDIGRVDLEVRRDSALAAAYRTAVSAATPVPVGTYFTLRASWGEERVRAVSVDSWNRRIVLVLEGSATMDSAANGRATVVASAWREPADRPATPSVAACDRTPVSGAYAARVDVLRDSLEQAMRLLGPPPYERLARRVTVSSSRVTGCFGAARVALAVSLRAGATEWTRERIVLVDTLGKAHPLAVDDLRFKVHDLLLAADLDGDGLDDLAAIGRTRQAGGTTLLRLDAKGQRLVRLAAGFAWEDL